MYMIFTSQLTNLNIYSVGEILPLDDTLGVPVVVLRLQGGNPEGDVVTQSLIHFDDDSFDFDFSSYRSNRSKNLPWP